MDTGIGGYMKATPTTFKVVCTKRNYIAQAIDLHDVTETMIQELWYVEYGFTVEGSLSSLLDGYAWPRLRRAAYHEV